MCRRQFLTHPEKILKLPEQGCEFFIKHYGEKVEVRCFTPKSKIPS